MNNLSRYRRERGLSQRDLAEIVGVSQPKIQRAEVEHESAMLHTYKVCAEYFGVTLAEMFTDRGQKEEALLKAIHAIDDDNRRELAIQVLHDALKLFPQSD